MGIPYATREQVLRPLQIMESAYVGSLIDATILSASRKVEALTRRRFYPERRTILLDWPNYSYAPTWEVDLGVNELISVETVTSGGTAVTSDIILRRYDGMQNPPYNRIQIDLSSNSAFSAGTTWQQSLSLVGLFGDEDTATDTARGQLSADATSGASTISLEPSSTTGFLDIGIGSLLLIGTERLLVIDKRMVDSGATISANVLATQNATTLTSASASSFVAGETILIDSERFLIQDIAGTSITVERAFDGTALATHSSGASIYALRTAVVQRGVLGSTAAAHTDQDAIYVHAYPSLVNRLTVAETLMDIQQQSAAYGRVIASGTAVREFTGVGIKDLREMVRAQHGRVSRSAAI